MLLERRLAVIADHAWRARDPSSHLDALKEVSLKIDGWSSAHRHEIDARLRHYLSNASYAKALDHLAQMSPRP
jgi:hypothetical protein